MMRNNISRQNSWNPLNDKENFRKISSTLIAISIFLLLFFGLPDTFAHSARLMTAIVCFGVTLWALEPIPMGSTALLILIMMLLFKLADTRSEEHTSELQSRGQLVCSHLLAKKKIY